MVELKALCRGNGVRNIEPNKAQITVICKNLFDLRLDLLLKANGEILVLTVGEVPAVVPGNTGRRVRIIVAAAVRLCPVELLRLIKPEFQTVLVASLCKLTYNISSKRRSIHNIELICLAVEQCKAVVML